MDKFTKFGLAAALAFGFSAPASSAFEPFSIDAQSVNFAGADVSTVEFIDFIGNSFIQNTFSDPTNFTFVDDGVFKISGIDGVPQLLFGGNELTAIFHAEGTGVAGAGINFTSGTLAFYSDGTPNYGSTDGIYGANDGALIGTFDLTSGSGSIDNDTLPNGAIELSFLANTLAINTWFDAAGNDMSTNPSALGFVTSNASLLASATGNLAPELVGEMAGFNSPTGAGFNAAPDNFLVSNNGQFRMQTVPEPTVLALMAIGLLGFGALRRFK